MAPRIGHFHAMERVFGYLTRYLGGQIVIDSQIAPIREVAKFNLGLDWIEFYPNAREDIPSDMPPAMNRIVTITCYVDADHARDQVT